MRPPPRDSAIVGQGMSGVSIADASINRSRSDTSTGSASGDFTGFPGTRVQINMSLYTFAPSVYCATVCYITTGTSALGNDTGTVTILDQTSGGAASDYTVNWRNFVP
jgi:hypothetical protein